MKPRYYATIEIDWLADDDYDAKDELYRLLNKLEFESGLHGVGSTKASKLESREFASNKLKEVELG